MFLVNQSSCVPVLLTPVKEAGKRGRLMDWPRNRDSIPGRDKNILLFLATSRPVLGPRPNSPGRELHYAIALNINTDILTYQERKPVT